MLWHPRADTVQVDKGFGGTSGSQVLVCELPPLSRSAGYLAPVGSRVVPDGSG